MNVVLPNTSISLANAEDIPVIRKLLNSAYRGESSRSGWTTEADLIAGDVRTDDNDVLQTMNKPGSVFLKYSNAEGQIIGCVNLQQQHLKCYLGMLSVSPLLQGGGIGKQLLSAAELYALQIGCSSIFMSVISARAELIAWYQRNGYEPTGERKQFNEDGLSGKHLQPLEFIFLQKIFQLKPS